MKMLKIVMSVIRKICHYTAQLINKVTNYHTQMFIQKTVFIQACRFLNRQN